MIQIVVLGLGRAGRPFSLTEAGKPTYHLAAMLASVFPYILLLKAGELARQAGVPDDQAGAIFAPILRWAAGHLQLDHSFQGDVDGQALYRLLTKLTIEYAGLDQAAKQKLTEALA